MFLTTTTVVFLTLQNANSLSPYEELYNNCLSISPRALCDVIFGKNSVSNVSNSTSLSNFSALTYNDKDLGFTVLYPLGWKIAKVASELNTVVRFVSPHNDANVDVRIFPKGDYNSIDDYVESFKDTDNEFKLLDYYRNSSTTLSGRPAVGAIYLTSYNVNATENLYGYKPFTSKEIIVATMVPERQSIYGLAYFTDSTNFDNYLPVFEKMVDSFLIHGK